MKDQINKQEKDIHALNTQTEDLTAKVEVCVVTDAFDLL